MPHMFGGKKRQTRRTAPNGNVKAPTTGKSGQNRRDLTVGSCSAAVSSGAVRVELDNTVPGGFRMVPVNG